MVDPMERVVNSCDELEDLAKWQANMYHKLKLVKVCFGKITKLFFGAFECNIDVLEGQEGLIKGYCYHDYRPFQQYIKYIPESLRQLEIVTKARIYSYIIFHHICLYIYSPFT